jgi:hypothetical protein
LRKRLAIVADYPRLSVSVIYLLERRQSSERVQMSTKKLIAVALAGSLAIGSFSTSALAGVAAPVPGTHFGNGASYVPWLIIGCAGGIILAALAANARDHRELTAPEAWSCGLLFWFSPPKVTRKRR